MLMCALGRFFLLVYRGQRRLFSKCFSLCISGAFAGFNRKTTGIVLWYRNETFFNRTLGLPLLINK